MQGEDVSCLGQSCERGMAVEQVQRRGEERGDIESRTAGSSRVELHQRHAGNSRAPRRQQGDTVSQLAEPPGQPDHYALRSAISNCREPAVEVEGDVHAGAMYRPPSPAAKQVLE